MKKVIILGVLALLLIVAGYYSLFSVSTDEMQGGEVEQAEVIEMSDDVEGVTGPQTGVGSLQSLLEQQADLGCTITYENGDETGTATGDVFVSDGKLRGDFLTDSPDLEGQVSSSMIITDTNMYVWSVIEGQSYGVKMNVSAMEEVPVENRGPVTLDQSVSFECFPWINTDETLFEPPGDVLFQDMGELMKAGFEEGVIYEEGAEMPN